MSRDGDPGLYQISGKPFLATHARYPGGWQLLLVSHARQIYPQKCVRIPIKPVASRGTGEQHEKCEAHKSTSVAIGSWESDCQQISGAAPAAHHC